ncbi:pre-60S factor rei1 [Linderina macrospora]|uniref:Pre-60S factor rei1 n=1 Tax=Linderina macrospora TaxID=4868 RepID=A0ACC1JF86_9FUNG|nr:pre-60S factor rei1 [Linderina macrospora]
MTMDAQSAATAATPSSIPMNAQSSPLFTCMACQVAFYSAEQQRVHYRTDWHRYNLKRKVVGLPSVTAENFAQRVLAQQAKAADDTKRAAFSADCDVCKKTYGSENAFNNHLNSKKHKEAEAKMIRRMQNDEIRKADLEDEQANEQTNEQQKQSLQDTEAGQEDGPKVSEFVISDDEDDEEDEIEEEEEEAESASMEVDSDEPAAAEDVERERRKQEREIKHKLNQATTEEEVLDLLEKKKKAAPRLNPDHDCLFCPHQSESFEQTMEHMAKSHSLFVPDLEYLVDLRGLIQYLANKISIANVCLYCSGRGRALQSLEAVRRHMLDKGHTKIAYETEIDVLEISDFYDFSSTYPDADQHDPDEELDEAQTAALRHGVLDMARVEEEDGELVLPSGERIGHRTLRRYYKQTIPMLRTEKDSVMIHKLLTNYAENPEYQNQIVQTSHNRELVMAQPHGRQAWKDMATFKEYKQRHDYKTAIGMRNNGLMKHFRQQNPF